MRIFTFYFILLLSFVQLSAQNLLVNPGFETWSNDRPTAWSISNLANASVNTVIFAEGTKSFNANTEQVNKTVVLTQNVAVTAGKTYTVRVSYFIQRGDGTDARIVSFFKNSLNKAIPMSLEDSLLLKGPGGIASSFPTELGVWKTYTCNVVAPVGATIFAFRVRSLPYSNVIWDNFSLTLNTTASITSSKTTLSGFSYVPGSGPSVEDSFTVRGSNLSGNITVTAPANYEISTGTGTAFSAMQSIVLSPVSGVVNATSIYVRLKAGLSINTYTGNISIQSSGVNTQNIALSGSVGNAPVVVNTSVTSIAGFSYNESAGPSGIRSFTISGSGLLNGITINAPTGYEISIFGSTSFIGFKTFTISQSNGLVAPTTIYVRLKAGLNADVYMDNLTISTNGTSSKTVSLSGAVNAIPVITTSQTALTGFRYEPGQGPSPEKSFTVSATGMLTALIITAANNYEISTESGSNFNPNAQLVLSQSEGEIESTTIYVRLKANLAAAVYNGTLTLQTGGGVVKNITLSGVVSNPLELNVSANSISGLGYIAEQGPSAQQSFTVSAHGLSSMLFITAPTNFEISTDGGTMFTGNDLLILPLSSGSIATTTVYVRLKAGLPASELYGGNLIINSGTDISKNIVLSGYVNPISNITISTTELTDFSYYFNSGPSAEQSFTFSAVGLSSKLTVSAPVNYELSLTDGLGFVGINTLDFFPSNGVIPTTTLYVRLKSGLAVDTYSGNITLTSTDTATKNISLNANVLLSTDNKEFKTNNINYRVSDLNIHIDGLQPNDNVELFSVSGTRLHAMIANANSLEISVQQKGIYVLKTNNKIVKIII